ncbi:hypothetical protein HDK77DRAFT_173256 [Phyllosticta capitalensis]
MVDFEWNSGESPHLLLPFGCCMLVHGALALSSCSYRSRFSQRSVALVPKSYMNAGCRHVCSYLDIAILVDSATYRCGTPNDRRKIKISFRSLCHCGIWMSLEDIHTMLLELLF